MVKLWKPAVILLVFGLLVGCKSSTEEEADAGSGTYNSITDLEVGPNAPSLTQSPLVTWKLGFPIFQFLEAGIGTSATSGANHTTWSAIGVATSHTFTGIGLSQCTQYYPMIRAKDANGNVLDTHVATTPFSVDIGDPTIPTSLVTTENGTDTSSALVSWTASTDNCSLAGYQYAVGTTSGGTEVVNWSPLGVVASHQVTTGASFTFGTQYYTSVKALDAVDNESPVATTSAWRLRSPSAYLVGTQNLVSGDFNQGASYMRWSSSTYNSDYFSHSIITNPETLTIRKAGDYLLHLTMPFQVTATCTGRCSIKASVVVNGVPRPDALANSSYVINTAGFQESSNHLVVYLEGLAVNDEVKIYVDKGTTQTGSMITESIQAYVEAILPGRNFFYATSTQLISSTNLNQAVATNVAWTQEATSSPFTFNSGSSEQIILNTAGNYLVRLNFPMEAIGVCATRNNVRMEVTLDGVVVPGGYANQGGIDCVNGHTTGSNHWVGMLQGVTANQVLRVQAIREGTSTNVIQVETGRTGSIIIEKMNAIENYISLTGTRTVGSTNWNIASSPIQWNTQIATDPTHFTHSTVAGSHQITISRAGSYLVLFNDYLTSATARTNVRIRVQKNGVDVSGGLCTSNGISNSAGNNESSCALNFYLNSVGAGDVITVTSTQEAAAGTVNSVSPALLTLLRVK